MAEAQEGPLIRAPSELSNAAPTRGGSNRQALKVAGLTLLATVLIAGQAFTAYMVYSHKEKLNTLESRSDRLEQLSRRANAVRTPMKMALPMRSLPMLIDEVPADDLKAKTTASAKEVVLTQCQREAQGLIRVGPADYRPKCDELGSYLAQQCWDAVSMCWCVDKNGTMLPDTMSSGNAKCAAEAAVED